MSNPCYEFTQNAWKKELCVNCQRSKGEHTIIENSKPKSSPVPAKRSSLLMKTSFNASIENVGENKLRRESTADDWPINDGDWCVIDEKSESSAVDQKADEKDLTVDDDVNTKQEVTSQNKMVLSKTKVSFIEDEPFVIGEDGGWDNLTSDPEDNAEDSDSSEDISFTEEEKEFLLLALENTVWNADSRNLLQKTVDSVRRNSSKEFEDVKVSTLWKADRFSTLRDCDKLLPRQFGTFPLRNKSSKTKLENMCEEKSKHSSNVQLQRISESDNDTAGKHVMIDDKIHSEGQVTKSGSKVKPELPKKIKKKSDSDIIAEQKQTVVSADENDHGAQKGDEDDVFAAEGEDLFETFNPDIDLESSTAGMALVDLLNDVLAKYSDSESFKGIEGHELLPEVTKEELKQVVEIGEEGAEKLESKFPKGSIKSKEFEAKLASLAATLDLSKKKGKKPAPRPPSGPPPEPVQAKLTANLPEPNFKMVTIGKPIFDQGQGEKPLSPKRTSDFQTEVPENTKPKNENRQNKKGITSFFRNILRRGRDSIDSSSEQDSSNDNVMKSQNSNVQSSCSSSESLGVKTEQPPSPSATEKKGSAESSPVLKMKVLPSIAKPARTSVIMTTSSESSAQKKSKQSPELSRTSKGSPKVSKKELPSKSLDKVQEEESKKKVVERKGSDKALDRNGSEKKEDKKGANKGVERKGSDKEAPSLPTKPPPITARPKPINLPAKPPPPPTPQTQPQAQTKPPTSPQPSTQISSGAKQMTASQESRESAKERSASVSSHEGGQEEKGSESPLNSKKPVKVRKRAKSPKRTTAPNRPQPPAKAPENRNSLFTKELEMKISRGLEQGKPQIEAKPKSSLEPKVSLSASQPSISPTSPEVVAAVSAMSASVTEIKGDNTELPVSPSQDIPPAEKIELPRAQSRKSFLGKLGNRKSKAPPRPPSIVKRAKSITENTLIGDGLTKKLDASDISGPMVSFS